MRARGLERGLYPMWCVVERERWRDEGGNGGREWEWEWEWERRTNANLQRKHADACSPLPLPALTTESPPKPAPMTTAVGAREGHWLSPAPPPSFDRSTATIQGCYVNPPPPVSSPPPSLNSPSPGTHTHREGGRERETAEAPGPPSNVSPHSQMHKTTGRALFLQPPSLPSNSA